jgi:tetratricopeptide (TPR) repeat protein
MRMTLLILALVLFLVLPGCVKTVSTLRHEAVGQYYLKSGKYASGEAAFQEMVKEEPDSAEAHSYLGRFQLVRGRPDQALPHLERAVALDPGKGDYRFHLGLAYGQSGKKVLEEREYRKTLALDKKHVAARVGLGRILMKKNKLREAFQEYQKALEREPGEKEALFYRAKILQKMDREAEEIAAWKEYLAWYPQGELAVEATDSLNARGKFDYRNHVIGKRRVTLEKIYFQLFKAEVWSGSKPSLDVVGAMLANNDKLAVHVVAYQKNNLELAKARALSVKRYFVKNFPTVNKRNIKPSWFDVPERIKAGKRTYQEPESIRFITVVDSVGQ